MDANTKVLYSQQLNTKNKKEVVNISNSGTVIDVSTESGKNVTAFITGSQEERDAFNAVQAHVLPTLNLLNRINQGKLGAEKRVNIQKVKGGKYRITDLSPITRSSESNKDNYLGRNPKQSAFTFFKEPNYREFPSSSGGGGSTVLSGGSSGSSSSSLALPIHPANNMPSTSSNTSGQSNQSGEAGLDVSAAQETLNNALDNPTKSINIGDVYKSIGQ